jgi:hypothetical protein
MTRPAFLVEGKMEQKIIQTICPGKPVRLINCNGDDVAIARVADFIETHVRLLNNCFFPIIIWMDREGREQTSEEIKSELLSALNKKGFAPDQFIIGIADRTSENWILAGDPDLSEYSKAPRQLRPNEATKGKNELKKQLHIQSYSETHDGYNLFMACNVDKMKEFSASFQNFVSQMTDLECSWLGQYAPQNDE